MHVGVGFDAHPLVKGRKLVLGGIEVPFDRGLTGWSDADVLTHALIDALFGAAALGDIGSHFPPGEEEYKGISSLVLLKKTKDILKNKGWKIVNVDATVVAEKPKLREHIDNMREALSKTMGIPVEDVSVKASTSSEMGATGRGEGMACWAVAMIEKE
jgi:2-C-methyl-D-erythritol 2,4-cyclodiphosphate synthase